MEERVFKVDGLERTKIQITLKFLSGNKSGASEREQDILLSVHPKSSLLSVCQTHAEYLQKHGIQVELDGHCNGRGSCGKCRVQFMTGAPLPSQADRLHFTAEELRKGMRLACTARLMQNCEVVLGWEADRKMSVVTQSAIAAAVKEPDRNGQRDEEHCFVAVDIGTTTVAMQLVETESGRILAEHCFLNPGRRYGADVISRIEASCAGGQELLQRELWEQLSEGVSFLFKGRNKEKPDYMVCTGNTAMEHILEGVSLAGMKAAPFEAGDISLREMVLDGQRVILMPGASAFVGGDIVSGVYACGIEQAKSPCLYLDLGTNGEMVLGCRERMLATATAAGPAFEGNATVGVYGADMTAVIAGLLRKGILDETGLLQEPYFENGIEADGVRLNQQNIREFQLAKAAVRCGIEELLREYGILAEEVECVFLAGGFGYYLKEEDALLTGIIPAEFAGKVRSVGNAALAGAVRFGMTCDAGIAALGKRIQVINLAQQEQFGEHYFSLLGF